MILEEIKKEIFNKQCEIENRGYVKGIGYVAITNEMQEDIDFLEKLKKDLENHSKEEQSYKEIIESHVSLSNATLELQMLSGYNIEMLTDLFKQGYTMNNSQQTYKAIVEELKQDFKNAQMLDPSCFELELSMIEKLEKKHLNKEVK